MNVNNVVLITCALICGFFVFCVCHDEQDNLAQFEFNHLVNLDDRCMNCICHAASGCNLSMTCAEVPGYCGPFKISKVYWVDTGKLLNNPNDDPEGDKAFEDCAQNYECSAQMIKNYMIKYGKDCNGDGVTDCRDFLMLHYNGGFSCHRSLDRKENSRNGLARFTECWDY